jgi:hypothetical protein
MGFNSGFKELSSFTRSHFAETLDTSTFVKILFFASRLRSLLRHCATSRKVAVSIPDGVTGIFY